MLLTYAGAHAGLGCPESMPGSATRRGGPVASNREDRNRVFGMPPGAEPYAREGAEPQRALGVPVDWYGPVDRDWFRSLIHPIKGYKRWGAAPPPGSLCI